ncbi:metal ABC transporter solute-binding protein, Zn/Mn family [Parabacteroides chinchillae]|uniref:Zinc transport system substrate-binding protein n=1 Tax=Parabacteroides chinchillae TaxID=871327 RepID=A0A8G2BWH7_9BACT|nr:zinc ABC transporter substrate-binding protein [Parabacteroides chinchillae]SEF87134.1 zinc transport system substrate-binding protein [Parabacteroides chinchillae]
MKHLNIWMICLSLCLLATCTNKQQDAKMISVTIEPQRYFAERIAGDKFKVNSVVPSGQSPETYDPTPQQMIQIDKSQAYFRIGFIGFEQAWMDNIIKNNPDLKIFDLSEGMEFVRNEEEHDGHHHEGEHHHHHPGGIDPHVWSSLQGSKVIAQNTLNAFIALDKENEAYYRDNYDRLMGEINQTSESITSLLEPLKGTAFIIYHPALTYLADEFGLHQLCIEMDGKEPSPAQLKRLIETAKEHDARVVFIQQEFDQRNAELIAKEAGCKLIRINPLDYDWNKEMIHIAQSLADGKAD